MALAFHVGDSVAGTLRIQDVRLSREGHWEYLADCQECGNSEWTTSRSLKRRKSCAICRDLANRDKIKYPIMDNDGITPIPMLVYLTREGMTGDPRDRIARWNSAHRDPKPYKTRDWILYGKSSKSRQDSLLDHLLNRWLQKVIRDTASKYQVERLFFEAVKNSFGKESRKEFRRFLRYELQLLKAEEAARAGNPFKEPDQPISEEALENFLIPVDPDDLD